MLKFLVFKRGHRAKRWPVRNAYLVGADGNALRGEVGFREGTICCENREGGTAALALQQNTGNCGELTLQTCLLPERDEPYLLNLELARHRLMALYNKLEDWGMFDLGPSHAVTKRAELARGLFLESLCCQNEHPTRADKQARDSLVAALDATEQLALAHADLLLERRKTTGAMPRLALGCGVALDPVHERIRAGMAANFDFLQVPVSWRSLAPAEGEYRWETLDNWAQWLLRSRMPAVAGPLVSFEPGAVPDWLFMWEHDFDTVRELIYEHIEQVVKRYRHVVSTWNVVSGLHVNSHFSFTFDQIIFLTRMAAMVVKDTHPTSKVIVELRQPFGEYYGQNQRSIPPLTYADLLIQGGVNFDGFNVKLLMGQPAAGQYTRDLMQVSNLLDQFAPLGKPLHLTIAAPSEKVVPKPAEGENQEAPGDPNCGHWRKPWSPLIQGHWLTAIVQIAMSKPFVETVTWKDLVDHSDMEMPAGGLIDASLQPKGAFRRFLACRRNLAATVPPSTDPRSATENSEGTPDNLGQNI